MYATENVRGTGNGSGQLVLHCGGERIDRSGLRALPKPQGLSPTHYPIAHIDFIEQTIALLESVGVQVVNEAHGLMRGGDKYFGVFGLGGGNDGDGYGLIVGLRNSHDRSTIAGLALGCHVFVCDNWSFSGEVTIERKHTRFIMRDLPKLLTDAVGKIVGSRRSMHERIEAYKATDIADENASDLMIRAMDCGIISPPKLPNVLKEWRQPSHAEFEPRTAWSLFNAFTETLKGYNADSAYARSQPLHGLFDARCGLCALPAPAVAAEALAL
jgi:hypothetical protein